MLWFVCCKQDVAYEMRISEWSSDVCSSDRNIGQRFDFQLAVGARLVFADGTPDIIAYPETRFGWGRLTRMLTIGNLRTKKGGCILYLSDLLDYCADLLLIVMPPLKEEQDTGAILSQLTQVRDRKSTRLNSSH